jgi:hypothetical protein
MFTEDIRMKVVKSTDISVLDVSVSLIQSGWLKEDTWKRSNLGISVNSFDYLGAYSTTHLIQIHRWWYSGEVESVYNVHVRTKGSLLTVRSLSPWVQNVWVRIPQVGHLVWHGTVVPSGSSRQEETILSQYFVDVVKDKRTKINSSSGGVTFLTTFTTRGNLWLICQGPNIWSGNLTRSGSKGPVRSREENWRDTSSPDFSLVGLVYTDLCGSLLDTTMIPVTWCGLNKYLDLIILEEINKEDTNNPPHTTYSLVNTPTNLH